MPIATYTESPLPHRVISCLQLYASHLVVHWGSTALPRLATWHAVWATVYSGPPNGCALECVFSTIQQIGETGFTSSALLF
jgi:hypothetical protein